MVCDPSGIGSQVGPVFRAGAATLILGYFFDLEGKPNDQQEIRPIVQLADWGETVSLEQWDKVEAMGEVYRAMQQQAEN